MARWVKLRYTPFSGDGAIGKLHEEYTRQLAMRSRPAWTRAFRHSASQFSFVCGIPIVTTNVSDE
jgi:hypothetical protein